MINEEKQYGFKEKQPEYIKLNFIDFMKQHDLDIDRINLKNDCDEPTYSLEQLMLLAYAESRGVDVTDFTELDESGNLMCGMNQLLGTLDPFHNYN